MACKSEIKTALRARRQKAVRRRVRGSEDRPRLCIFRSGRHMYCQVINDATGTTVCALSTLSGSVKSQLDGKKPVEQAKILGIEMAKACREKSISKVCFDRNGFIFHGRVAAVADGAREGGLEF